MIIDVQGCQVLIPDNAANEMPLIFALGEGIDGVSAMSEFMECRAVIAALPVSDWNAELTPWPAPPLRRGKEFAGNAIRTLERLDALGDSIPAQLETVCNIAVSERLLIGYSLGGLCALWVLTQRSGFVGAASASGSLWYDGFKEYLSNHAVNAHAVYLSLGDAEPRTRDKRLSLVADNTLEIYDRLIKSGINVFFEWNVGNHFVNAPERSARGADWLCKNARLS